MKHVTNGKTKSECVYKIGNETVHGTTGGLVKAERLIIIRKGNESQNYTPNIMPKDKAFVSGLH